MSESVPTSPSPLKSQVPQEEQHEPARHAKNASMSWSVPTSPSPSKSGDPQTAAAVTAANVSKRPRPSCPAKDGFDVSSDGPDPATRAVTAAGSVNPRDITR